jgi:hypothetical protein
MVKGKMTPSPRLYKPRSNKVMVVVFPVSRPGRKVFWNTKLPTESKKNDIDTIGWHGGAKKIAEKRASRKTEDYTGVSKNTIP